MVMAYATVTGRIVVPGTTTGIPGEITATPLTEGGVLAFPSEDYTTVGPAVADVTGDGTLSPSLKIPTDVPEGTLWRLTFVPKGKGKLPVRLGDYEISASTDIADLVPVTPTVITPTMAAKIDAGVAALSGEDTAVAFLIEDKGSDVRGALSATYATVASVATKAAQTDLDAVAGSLAGTYNIGPATTRKARIALGKVRSGVGSMKIACVGDSTTWGAGSTGGSSGLTYRAQRTSYPAQLRGLLNQYYAPTVLTAAPGVSKNDASATDARWGVGSGWAIAFVGFGGASGWQSTGTTGALTFTPDTTTGNATVDTFDVYWVRNTGLGSLAMSINGGTTTNVTTAGGPGAVMKTTLTATASASNVLSILATGTCYVVAVDAYLSTAKQIRLGNFGVSGSRATEWNNANTGSALMSLKAWAPDLSIIMLGINDSKNPVTADNFNTALSAIVDAAQVSGDVILMSVVPSSQTGTVGVPDYAFEAAYRDKAKALALTKGAGYIDIYGRFGSYAIANAAGWMFDTIHPHDFGYSDIASAVLAGVRVL